MSSKETYQYSTVLHAITSAAEEFHIDGCVPQKVMCDFELSIINACYETYDADINCCFFHLGSNVYKHVQSSGLQEAYNNPDDRSIKIYTHMMLSLAYVPVQEVVLVFNLFKDEVDEVMAVVVEYFDKTYVNGIRAQGKRRAVAPTL